MEEQYYSKFQWEYKIHVNKKEVNMKLELAILLRRIKEKIGTVALILFYIVIIGVILYIVKYII